MKNKNTRILNIMFSKAGSGSISSKMALPKDWINSMRLSPEDRRVIACFDEDNKIITIKKEN